MARQTDGESGAFARTAFDGQFAAMGANNSIDDEQAKACSARFCRIIRLHQPLERDFVNARARICKPYMDMDVIDFHVNHQASAFRHGLDGILN